MRCDPSHYTAHRPTLQSKDKGDDAAKRAWAKAATQRVLDLMLVTERVRQEEQKRRVAAARANSQVGTSNAERRLLRHS